MNTIRTASGKINMRSAESASKKINMRSEESESEKSKAVGLLLSIIYAVCTFLFARSRLLSAVSPLGSAAVAACPKRYLPLSFAASVIGILTGGGEEKLKYLAAAAAICSIRWAVGLFGRFADNRAFCSALAFGTMLSVSFSMTIQVRLSEAWPLFLCEAVLCAAAAYVFSAAADYAADEDREMSNGGPFALMTLCLALGCSAGITYSGMSPFMVLTMAVVLCFAFRLGVFGGACAAVAAALSVSLAQPDMLFIAFGLAAGGLIAGAMSGGGRIFCAVGFGVTLAVYTYLTDSHIELMTGGTALLAEWVLASAIFFIIPKNSLARLDGLLLSKSAMPCTSAMQSLRLSKMSKALLSAAQEVRRSEAQTQTENYPIMRAVGRGLCMQCELYRQCYGKYGAAIDRFYRQEDENTAEDIISLCMRKEEMRKAVNEVLEQKRYHEELSRRAEGMKQALSCSLENAGLLLNKVSGDMTKEEAEDEEASARLQKAFLRRGIKPLGICALREGAGRLKITVLLGSDCTIETERLRRIMQSALGRSIQAVNIYDAGGDMRIATAYESFGYSLKTVSAGRGCSRSGICGDICDSFETGSKSVMTLCDGMGTGGRAAMIGLKVSQLLRELLQSSMEYRTALSTVSSAVAVDSAESLCTVDMAVFDLNTAELELIKAGGALSFIRSGQEIRQCGRTGLPIGILQDISCDSERIAMKDGDILVLVSDGVLGDDNDWIAELTAGFKGDDLQRLADDILSGALSLHGEEAQDDMSVFIGRVERNYEEKRKRR